MKITLDAYAKINLFLDVVGRLENGYHEIRSLMQSVSLSDRITVSIHAEAPPTVTLTCDSEGIPTDGRNLAVRAANAFYGAVGYEKRTEIHIEKHIPVAAGLAGGSTDAAAVLVGLNRLFGEPLTVAELCDVGKTLGADIPFCILSGAAEVSGIGDLLSPLPDTRPIPLVVAKHGEGVSTPEAYRALDLCYGDFSGEYKGGTTSKESYELLLSALSDGNADGISRRLYNVFEKVVLEHHAEARALKKFLLENGALSALMSGSGPSVFAIFKSVSDADRAAERLNARVGGEIAFSVHTVGRDRGTVREEV